MFFVVDLDGTLALIDHRRHLVDGSLGKKDFDEFFERCDMDLPHIPVVETILALTRAGHHVEIWSGRSDQVALKTKAWLRRHGLDELPLKMRKRKDYRPDEVIKEEWLLAALAEGRCPDMVFDDRAKVVRMWRAHGVVCAQVAPGEF